MEKYNPSEIEPKWQKIWQKQLHFKGRDLDKKRKKFYALVEFPYPSGEGLHVGHARTYITLDVFARKKIMAGDNVLYPMGWDAFGLPTENYAIKTGVQPALATKKNTDRFHQQMNQLALAYDWEREIDTTDPDYYQWTQWIFIQLFKRGLAYKKNLPINWCPACKIGLANEEVVNGCCERCGAPVGQKKLAQWLLRITAYADRLADELDLVDFPESVITSQRNWIGKSEGVEVKFTVHGSRFTDKKITVFTTRADTLFGATAVVLAPEHPIVTSFLSNTQQATGNRQHAVKEYVEASRRKSEFERTELAKEKSGVFTGLYCLNPINNESIPIWIADYVVASYGGGAVMVVPAHDQRDFEFAKKYNLPIKTVILPPSLPSSSSFVFEEDGVLVNSDQFNGLSSGQARQKITAWLEKNSFGKKAVNYHLRDWIFSRQHYWGEPIPMIYCPKCGWVPVPEDQLPVKLPEVKHYQPTDSGESPLVAVNDWVKTKCPLCGGVARRETDTMPNWAGSSWYFLAYPIADKLGNQKPKTKNQRPNKENVFLKYENLLKYWLPVDLYFGGSEHTTLHLLYSRFWHKFLNDIGVVPGKEPYLKRKVHGVVLGEDGRRMSKSKGNVITQEEVIKRFGADSLRVFSMFMGPYDGTFSWSTAGIRGTRKFLEKFYHWFLAQLKKKNQESEKKAKILVNRLIKRVGEDIDNFKFNTAVAKLMEFLNKARAKEIGEKDLSKVLRLLAPFAPHLAEELWQYLRNTQHAICNKVTSNKITRFTSIHLQSWPKYDEEMVEEEITTIVVEVDGKVRKQIEVQSAKCKVQSEIEKLVREEERVKKYLVGRKIKRVVFVPGKLINFVTS